MSTQDVCATCGVHPRKVERRECWRCINVKAAVRKQPKPIQHTPIDTGDPFRDELIRALVAMDNSTLPLLGEGMTS